MSRADVDEKDDEGGLEDVPARSIAFDAVVRTAVDRAGESSSYRRRFGTGRVERALEGEVSTRTVRRALKDAEALGWVTKGYGDWRPGDRAKALLPDEDDEEGR